MKSKNFFVLTIAFSFVFCNFVFAETPVVRSFLFSRASVMSRQPISFSWSVDRGGAPDLWFICPSGVRLTKTDGTAFSCNTRQTLSDLSSDAIDFIVTNTSGSYQTLKATLTPRDASGSLFPDLVQTVSVSVSPDQDPIDDFTSSASTTERVISFQPIVVSWVAHGTSGVNFKRVCGDSNITATSSETTLLNIPDLPCNQNLFSTDLSNTGSFTIYLSNMAQTYSDFKLTILPAMESGLYDGTHAETLVFSVEPYKPPVFSVTNFGFLDSKIYHRASTTLSWSSSGSSGINFKSSCQGDLSIYFSYGATTTLSHCNEYMFDGFLNNVGTSTVYLQGYSNSFQSMRLFMIPKRSDGSYDSTLAKSLDVMVQPSTVQPSFWVPTNSVVNVQTNTPTNLSYVPKNQFTRYLSRGSTGAEVIALQTFLKQYPDLYPERLVTGMYGPATERAVKRFQEKYKIAYVGSLGYGNVGVKTRAKLNEF